MFNHLFQEVQKSYSALIPTVFNALIIFTLDSKIKQGELKDRFTQKDIAVVIQEVAKVYFPNDSLPNTEPTVKKLIPYFLERPPDHRYETYSLTDYALNFIQLIQNKLTNPFRNFPLKESFTTYFSLQASSINEINQFKSWFTQGFDATSRRLIGEHLEALQDEVDNHINTLNSILQTDCNALEMVHKFADTFGVLGQKATDLSNALQLKGKTLREINKVIEFFYIAIAEARHPQNDEETKRQEEREDDWLEAKILQQQVINFFNRVDMRLESIRTRIIFASSKLNELQENFQLQSKFKLNLKRLLKITLEYSSYHKDNFQLADSFPLKTIVEEKTVFTFIPFYKFELSIPNYSIKQNLNEDYQAEKTAIILNAIEQQEKITKWVNILKEKLTNEQALNFSESFYEIANVENGNLEIPLQVGFELLQFASKKNSGYQVQISKELEGNLTQNNIHLWKMKILKLKELLTS